jgi:hypothetical protein
MDPLTVSAQFAAYMWFSRQEKSAAVCRTAAMQFARSHWEDFLPIAQKGLGRLLLRLAKAPRVPKRAPVELATASASSEQVSQRFSLN